MKILAICVLLVVVLLGYTLWKNLHTPSNIGFIEGKLSECPSSPNCVSSFAKDEAHYIEPIKFNRENPLSLLIPIILENYRVIVEPESGDYLHAVFISEKMRYRDDVEFLVDNENKRIHIRSASRVGYADMGVNRSRIEQIRRLFADKDQ